MASGNNLPHIVTLLIAAGADVDKTRVDGCTPLHAAAVKGHADVADLLIAAGANVNATSSNGKTALLLALARGHALVVQKLRAAGATGQSRTY